MKRLVLGSLVVSLTVLFSGCATQEAVMKEKGLEPLTKSAIKSAIVGKTLAGNHHRGWDIKLTNNPDGTFVLNNISRDVTIKGKWRISGTKYCNQSNGMDMRRGREGCFPVYKDGDIYNFVASNGSIAFSLK